MSGTQASSSDAAVDEIERLVGAALQQISSSSPPGEDSDEEADANAQQELAVLNTFLALSEVLTPKVPSAYLSIQALPAEHTLWDRLVSLCCKAAPKWLARRPLSPTVFWVQTAALGLAQRLDACLGGAKAALHLPAVHALLERTTLRVSLWPLQGMLRPGDLHYNYPSLLAALRLAALAARQMPGCWDKDGNASTADVLLDLVTCAFQHCCEFAQKRLGVLTGVPSEPRQRELRDLAEGLKAASAVLNDIVSHVWETFRVVPTCILEQMFAASEKAFQLFKAADRLGSRDAAVCLRRSCVRCSLRAVHLLGNAEFYTHPKEGPPRSLPPPYYKHSLEVAVYLSASLSQATDTYGPQPGAGNAAQAAAQVTEDLRGLLRDEIETLHEAVTLWALALQHPSLISTVPEFEDVSYVLQYLPDAEAAGWGLQLSEQLMRLAAKRKALAAIVPLPGIWGQERDSSGMELTPCGCRRLLTTSQLSMMSMQFLHLRRSLAPADLTAWLRSTRSLVLTAAKLVRSAGAAPVTDSYNYDRTSVACLLQVSVEAACQILKVHPAYGASGHSRGAPGVAAAAARGKAANLTAHMREVGFLAFGGLPALLDAADDMIANRFCREVLGVLRDVQLVDEAVHASLGTLLCRIFRGQVARQKHSDAASVVGSCFDILSPETAGLAIALVQDGLLAAAVDWALSAPLLDGQHTTGPASNRGPSYVPILLRALCEAVDGAGGTQQLSLHPILKGIPTAGTFYDNPAGVHRMPWAQRFMERGTWQRVKQELLPLIREVCSSFTDQANSEGPGQEDTSAVFRDVAVSAGGCANARCTNLRGAREESLPLSYCGACKEARYCSRACQTQDWKRHKCACAALRKSKGLS